jgi:beta-galactosidase/beta-glucuronidase
VGRELFVDGQPFRIRGVNWNPVGKGMTHPGGLDFAGFADQDIALMKAAGINAVRTYERIENRAVLDKLHAAGIFVFSTVLGWWEDAPSVVTARVNAVKDHPAILAWVLGNEWNYNRLYSEGSRDPAFSIAETRERINQAAALIKSADPLHPISTIYGELDGLAENVAAMPDIDLWGINTYRGLSHGNLFTQWQSIGSKPMYLGEYGADAFDSRGQGQVDVESQALAVSSLTQELIDNYATGGGGVTLGGFVFEWADEWWKAGDPNVQDRGGVAPGGGPHPDATFNEEFWGIVDIERKPRPAYDGLKALYAP